MARLPSNFTEDARERIRTAREGLATWRRTARDDYAFVSGKQWTEADEQYLNEQRRPPITFNYSEKMIDAVVGAEVNNRQEISYKPRGMEDVPLSELWTNAARWVRDQCNAEDEETDAFRDSLICGLGWTETRLSYEENADGMIIVDRCDPLEMGYDPAAIKRGLTDRRFDYRSWWVNRADVRLEWPNAPDFTTSPEDNAVDVITRGHRYEDDTTDISDEASVHRDQIFLTHYETFYREPYYRIAIDDQIQELPKEDFSQLREELDRLNIPYVKQHRKVYYHAYLAGDTLLEASLSPCQRGFIYNPITAKRDRNSNTWYGLNRVMKDPQRWANKWLSQIIHIINSNAKGGLLAEVGAFVDPRKAADEWADAQSITMLNEGGITRVQQRQPAPYPAGLDRLMDFALGSLPMVTGINLEALGLANREQANVLETQRKQAAYGMLSGLFDALRMYRKTQGRVLLYFINTYLSDGRLIRISGPGNEKYLPLTKQPNADSYDVIVDQSPTAPDIKQRTFDALTATLPAMLKAGLPIPPDLLDYLPIPNQLSQSWKAHIQQAQQSASPEQLQQLQQQLQQLQQENTQLKQRLTDKTAEIQQKSAASQAELQLKAQELQAELTMKRVELEADIALKRAELASKTQLATESTDADIRIKSASALMNADPAILQQLSDAEEEEMETARILDALQQSQDQQQRIEQLILQLANQITTRPTSFSITRDANGRPTGIIPAAS